MKNVWFIRVFLGFTKLTGLIPAWLFFKPRIFRAQKKLPKGCIVVSNHKSLLDFRSTCVPASPLMAIITCSWMKSSMRFPAKSFAIRISR